MSPPPLLAAALALLVAWAAGRRRLAPLALGCALYPLSTGAWQVALGLAAAAELARVAAGQAPRWKTPLTAAAALPVGLLLRPRLPDLGGGAAHSSWTGATLALALVAASAALASLWLAWKDRRLGHLPLALAFPAVAFGALTGRDAAYLPHLVLFSATALLLRLERRLLRRPLPRLGP